MIKDKDLPVAEGSREGLARASELSRGEVQAALRAGREAIGMWPLMVWAYSREMVRFTCGSDFRPAKVSQSTLAWAIAAAVTGIVGGRDRGADFPPCCHDDALTLHGIVLGVIDAQPVGAARRQAFELMVKHAEVDDPLLAQPMPPTWNPRLEELKAKPVLRANGKPKCIRRTEGRHEAMACLVEFVGHSEEDKLVIRAEAMRRYAEWARLLDEVINRLGPEQECLIRWRVAGLGAEREPWSMVAQRAA